MATIQVRDVPDEAYEILRQRAQRAGQSLQAFMRGVVIDYAFTSTKQELFQEIEGSLAAGGGIHVDPGFVREAIDEGRR